MIQIERRAFYNLLRLNWEMDSTLEVQPWQVEDYRILPTELLFNRLNELGVSLNRISFINHADNCESPEELSDQLVADEDLSTEEQDKIYLLVFELWRRLMSEKPSLSILGDELDYQISLYDKEILSSVDPIQEVLNRLEHVLEDNVYAGVDAQEALKLVSVYCANDLEAFLYDFVASQIENDDELYAKQVFEQFAPYLEESKWFALLSLRFVNQFDSEAVQNQIQEIVSNYLGDKELEFNLDFLNTLLAIDAIDHFPRFALQTTTLLKCEEDFQELLSLCIDYYEQIENETQQDLLEEIVNRRNKNDEEPIDSHDKDLCRLIETLKKI